MANQQVDWGPHPVAQATAIFSDQAHIWDWSLLGQHMFKSSENIQPQGVLLGTNLAGGKSRTWAWGQWISSLHQVP